jgi:hypothetical protein
MLALRSLAWMMSNGQHERMHTKSGNVVLVKVR